MNRTAIEVHKAYKIFRKERPPLPWEARSGDGDSARVVAVDRVSFRVEEGEIFGVLGPNGSGKSTLVRLIATLLLPDGGKIEVFDHDVVTEPMAVQSLINRVSVEAAFFKKLSPMENLTYGARLYGWGGGATRERIVSLLTDLGVRPKAITNPMQEMSRGMQQMVAVARALLTRPVVLLLDEPTTGLDPRSKRKVHDLVRDLRDQQGTTILLTTHDMREAEVLCDRVAIMDRGRIVALDTPERLRSLASEKEEASLEDVFLELTGRELVQEEVS